MKNTKIELIKKTFFLLFLILVFIKTQMSTPSFIAALTSKVVSGNAAQLGMTRQNTTNVVSSTSSFDIYGRPSALSTNFRETMGMDPMYRMCAETSVSRPQYSYYLNPSLGLNPDEIPASHYNTMSTADQLTGSNLGRHTQSGVKATAEPEAEVDNADIPYDDLLMGTRKRFSAP
jgi:hypothetical protein